MNRYPTDEELNAFIERMEQQELYAPKHLKQQILEKVSEEAIPKRSAHQSVQMFAYSFKVIAGMAAAILMLILSPMEESRAADNGADVYREQRLIEGAQATAQREAKQEEAYRIWEEKLLQEVQKEENGATILEKGRNAIEQKITHVMGNLSYFWNEETEEN